MNTVTKYDYLSVDAVVNDYLNSESGLVNNYTVEFGQKREAEDGTVWHTNATLIHECGAYVRFNVMFKTLTVRIGHKNGANDITNIQTQINDIFLVKDLLKMTISSSLYTYLVEAYND